MRSADTVHVLSVRKNLQFNSRLAFSLPISHNLHARDKVLLGSYSTLHKHETPQPFGKTEKFVVNA